MVAQASPLVSDHRVFGNLRWSRCGKSDEDRRLYKAQLCSSCHAMHQFSGRTSSLLANYDQSLLVLVLSAVVGGKVEERRCTAVPWRTVAVQDLPVALRGFVAAGNLALIDAKLRDDVDDGGRWYAGFVRFWLRRKTRKAMQELARTDFPIELVADLPARQLRVEQTAEPRLAAYAEPSAQLLAEVFAHGVRLAGVRQHVAELRQFGAAVARAVYGLDALEDHDDDRQHGRFNAVAAMASRLGHEAAVAAARQFVDYAAMEAQQCVSRLLPEDRQRMVAAILQQLTQRAGKLQERLLGRPAVAAMRPAEAGDCDCACDGCGSCDSCDCSGCDCSPVGCHGGSCCCDGCDCCVSSGSKRKAKKLAQDVAAREDRPSGMPMR